MRLTEEEATDLMNAVANAIKPWRGRVESTILFDDEEMTIRSIGVLPEAPPEIRELDSVYGGILAKGAIAVDPERIANEGEKK